MYNKKQLISIVVVIVVIIVAIILLKGSKPKIEQSSTPNDTNTTVSAITDISKTNSGDIILGNENAKLTNIKVRFTSAFFDTEKTFSLDPYEKKEINIDIDRRMIRHFEKIESCLYSCKTIEQVNNIDNMIDTFRHSFQHRICLDSLPILVVILNRKLRKYLEVLHSENKDTNQ